MEKVDLLKEICCLEIDIDKCIGDLVKARLKEDVEAEKGAIFKMESLMCGTLQELSLIKDYLKNDGKDELEG